LMDPRNKATGLRINFTWAVAVIPLRRLGNEIC
jgi:hypothetical protein